jgi:hypothetical protein
MSAPVPAPPPVGGPPDDPETSTRGDLVAGSLLAVLGAAFAVGAYGYDLGDFRTMGAGMFPFLVGLVLVVLGVSIALKGASGKGELTVGLTRIPWRGVVCIAGAVLLFGNALEHLGFVLTVALTALVACLASPTISIIRAALCSLGITVACYAVFVLGLQLRLPLWP